jgi:hypothetical protein
MTESVGHRHPEFSQLQKELEGATAKFNQAASNKHALLANLSTGPTVNLEDRVAFIQAIKREREAYYAVQEIQEKFVALLRDENQGNPDAH